MNALCMAVSWSAQYIHIYIHLYVYMLVSLRLWSCNNGIHWNVFFFFCCQFSSIYSSSLIVHRLYMCFIVVVWCNAVESKINGESLEVFFFNFSSASHDIVLWFFAPQRVAFCTRFSFFFCFCFSALRHTYVCVCLQRIACSFCCLPSSHLILLLTIFYNYYFWWKYSYNK